MIIEFYGLPGSGKTTIAMLVRDILAKDGVETHFVSPNEEIYNKSIFSKFKEIYKLRKIFMILPIKDIFVSNSFKDLKVLISSLVYTSMYYSLSSIGKTNKDLITIIDEGFLQRIFSLFSFHKIQNTILIKEYINAIPESQIKIYLKVSSETALKRMKQRGSFPIRMQNMDLAEIMSILKIGEKTFDKLQLPNTIEIREDFGDKYVVANYICNKIKTYLRK